MKLKMITNNCFVNPESIQYIKITGDYSYSIHLEGSRAMDCDLLNKDILAVDFVKDTLIPLLME